MKLKQKKYLAQAITLGLLLAPPLGAQAKDYNGQLDYYGWEGYASIRDFKRGEYDGSGIEEITYKFNVGDKIVYTANDGNFTIAAYLKNGRGAGVYENPFAPDAKVYLRELSEIESKYDPSIKVYGIYGIYAIAENLTIKLDDCKIVANGNARLVEGSYVTYNSQYSSQDGTTLECGKMDISAESSYNGTEGGWVYGVCVNTKSSAILGDYSTISSSGKSSEFIQAWGVSAQFDANSVQLGSNTTINTNIEYTGDSIKDYPDYEIGGANGLRLDRRSNGESVGIYADSGEFIVGDNLTINSMGSGTGSIWVRGINAQMDLGYSSIPNVMIGDNANVQVKNKAITGTAYGMFINAGSVTVGTGANIISQAEIDNEIKTENKDGIRVRGIYIDKSNNHPDMLEYAAKANATVEFGDGAIIQAINNSKGGETTGVYAHDNVIFNGSSQIVAQAGDQGGHDTYGVYATSEKGNVNLGTVSAVSVINNSNDNTADTVGIRAVDSSKVTMRGGSITGKSADGENFKAIVTSEAAQVNVNEDGAQNIIVEGNLEASTQSEITLKTEKPQSYLVGSVTTDDGDKDGDSKTDLTFKNTTWYMTGDSNVTNLTLDNGVVSMVENANSARTVSGNAHKLSIDKALNGSGTFIMDLTYHDNDVESYEKAADSDFIYIHGGDNSEQRLVFKDNNSNLGAMASDDKLYFAQIKQDAAIFGEGGANVGEYNTVTAVNEKGIYDLEFYIDSEASAAQAGYNDWFITGKTKKANPNGDSPIHSYNAGFALWRDDDTLLKRLGELRFTNDEGGAWARVIGKKLEDKRSLGFNTHAKTVQVGYDRKDVQEDGSGTWRKGVALGHTWADTSFRSGKGKNNYTDLTLYATNIRKHDHYWDLVARIGYIDSEYDTAYGDHGEFGNWAGSLSAEYGRKKKINEDNWFFEPQAQLTYSYMWGDTYTTRNGAQVVQSNADSLVGRAGFVISKELESELKYPHRYYAKAFIMHEFLDGGDNNIYFGSDRLYGGSDFKDTWYVVGVGANVDMGNSCTFYFDAERNFKAHVKMPYRIEAGFRWEF